MKYHAADLLQRLIRSLYQSGCVSGGGGECDTKYYVNYYDV